MDKPRSLRIHPIIAHALQAGQPVVALESTIITHGMPYPQNVETALLVEQTVRREGALPATIALLDGKMEVGLDEAGIDALGKMGRKAHKTSRRDIAWVLAQKLTGATTVAATMLIAHLAGIRIFATGGIGGVHRNAPQSFDVSADLRELGRTPVAVVCAGAKSILDLPLTLEYLETEGVPVIGFQTSEFPAFFSRNSGLALDISAKTPGELADILLQHWALPHSGGIVVANPIPEDRALEYAGMEALIQQALDAAQQAGIKGKAITPFLLEYLEKATKGESLKANIELVLHNAQLAARLAKCWSQKSPPLLFREI